MFPFFYPTTVLLVDDDPAFLAAMLARHGEALDLSPISDRRAAIARATASEARRLAGAQLFAAQGTESGDPIFRLEAHRLARIMGDAGRFEQISVAVLDMAMPDRGGLAVCRELAGLPLRKLLLTGKGTDTAIAAFNEGLIDGYLSKHDADLARAFVPAVRRLQDAWFRRTTTTLKSALALQDMGFLRAPAFKARFEELCRTHDIVEHYVTTAPPGIVLAARNGMRQLLLVYGEQHRQAHVEIASAARADQDLIVRLAEGSALAWFPGDHGYYEPRWRERWREHLWEAIACPGAEQWRLSLVPERAWGKSLGEPFASYAAYRRGNGRA
jgi:CheY-like chemotaxis protein